MSDQLHLLPKYRNMLQDLLRQHLPDVEVWAYGSRVNGRSHDGSDLDLVLRGPDLNEVPAAQLREFEEAVQDSNIPFLVEARDWARLPERFHREIEREHVVLVEDSAKGAVVDPDEKRSDGSEWRKSYLGDLLSFANGKSSPARSDTSSQPVYGSNGVIGFSDRTNAGPNTIVIGRVGTYCGSLHYSDRMCWVTDNAIRANAISGHDARFLFYLLRTLRLNDRRAGSGQPLLNQTILSSIQVVVPDPKEQRAIAHILSPLDDKIESIRRMNETLEAMVRALFKSWFVDFDPVRAKMEGRQQQEEPLPSLIAGGHHDLFPDRLVDSEVGLIPHGWDVKPLGELVDVVGGTTPSTKVVEYWSGGAHCWATPKDLSSLSSPVLLDTERKITDTGLDRIGSGLLPPGTLLLSSRAPIGYLAISEEPVAINQGFIAVPPGNRVSNLFLLYWCDAFHEEIVNHANGSTFLEINRRNFRRIPMSVAPKAITDEFEKQARPLYARMVANQREVLSLAAQREALLPKLTSGELRKTQVDMETA